MLHGREAIPFEGIKDRSLIDKIIHNVNPHIGPVWIALFIVSLFIGGSYGLAYLMDKQDTTPINQVSIEAPVDIEGLLRSSISNVQKQGKLVVTSMDLQSLNTSQQDGFISTTEITTASWAKVQFTMDLHKFDPNWISVKGTDILITIPSDYIQAEILGTNSKDVDNSGWWSSEEEKKKLHDQNTKVNQAQMMQQANSMLDVVRPAAAQELKNMFSIPLKAVNQKFTIKVNVG